jgi:dipeptidyl aminopeptidase/acylaminoacyl peptidase
MSIDEQDLRTAFREAADATPIPDRWDEIVAGSDRARRRRTLAMSGSAVVALAAAIAVAVVAMNGGGNGRFVVRAGATRRAAVSVFPGGPTVALGQLTGGRLAFVSDSRLYVVDAAGNGANQLTKSGDASALTWSSDGEWLAFSVRNAPGYEDYSTWITRPDGTGAQVLHNMGDTFAWSPSGHQLAIAGFCCTSDRRGGVFLVDPGREPRQLVAPGSQILTVAWAPDGRTVGYTASAIYPGPGAQPEARTVGVDGTHPTLVSSGELASWSPDGRSVLVLDNTRVELFRVADGTRHEVGTSVGSDPQDPAAWSAFSPAGDAIAVVVDEETGRGRAIVVCHTDGTACRRINTTDANVIEGLSFSPDGTQLTYVSDSALRMVTIAGQTVTTLDSLGRDLLQGAGDGVHITRGTAPNVPAWLTDGTILYRRGAELRIIDPATRISQRIVAPLGFFDAGAADHQGLPGGTPVAAWNLTTRRPQ